MASLHMDGPFDLTRAEVERVVRESMAGNFAIGLRKKGTGFVVKHVGRSDSDVRAAILKHLPRDAKKPGMLGGLFGKAAPEIKFKFSYAADPEAAYSKQCRNFHDFGETEKLSNAAHPEPPKGRGAKCEVCGA